VCIYACKPILLFTVYYLYQQIHIYIYIYIYIYILHYIRNAPTCSGVSAPSSGSFGIAFAKVMKH
jgi:hypothetical protein